MVEQDLKIKEIIQRTYNVKSFRLEINDQLDFKAGQFLQVTLNNDSNLKRYLSISSSPTEKGYIEFTKKITESDFSKVLNNLRPGDVVGIKYPFGSFTFNSAYKKIAFISGGIGITPIRSICKYVVDSRTGTDIVLIYSNRTVDDIAFKDDLQEMQKDYTQLKVVHILSEGINTSGYKLGRVSAEVIQESIPNYKERRFYLCGPPAMVEAMKGMLSSQLEISQDNIITENFQGY